MREMRWRQEDLDAASPETVARLRWLLFAERVARYREQADDIGRLQADLALFPRDER